MSGMRARRAARTVVATALVAIVASLGLAQWAVADAPATVPTPAASRMLMWVSCEQVARLTDAQLDHWRDDGVGGFACDVQHLRNMGGTQQFTDDPDASLTESQ